MLGLCLHKHEDNKHGSCRFHECFTVSATEPKSPRQTLHIELGYVYSIRLVFPSPVPVVLQNSC